MNTKNRRLALLLSGAMDMLIGAAILLLGLGFLPVDVNAPPWTMVLIGAILFIAGTGVATYNISRWSE